MDRDILVACAMLHDVGKIMELSDFPENDYTDEGQLLGHIFIGAELIRDTAAKIEGFPQKLVTLLMHCILSHHGELEYGSPKVPETIEAFILHCADNMDAKTKMFEEMLAADNTQGSWAGYHRSLPEIFVRVITNDKKEKPYPRTKSINMTTARISGIMNGSTAGRSCGGFIQRETHACI